MNTKQVKGRGPNTENLYAPGGKLNPIVETCYEGTCAAVTLQKMGFEVIEETRCEDCPNSPRAGGVERAG
jgi:hypothetical protein